MHNFLLNSIKIHVPVTIPRGDNLLPVQSILFQLSSLLGGTAFQQKSDSRRRVNSVVGSVSASQITLYKVCVISNKKLYDYTQSMIGQNRLTSACSKKVKKTTEVNSAALKVVVTKLMNAAYSSKNQA